MEKIDFKDPEWLAEQLGLDKNTVYKFLQDGRIPALQLGRKWLVSEAQVAEWLKSEVVKQTQARQEALASTEHVVRQMTNYSDAMCEVLRRAHAEARRYGHRHLGQEHLVLAMAEDPSCSAARIMSACGIKQEQLRQSFERRCPSGDGVSPRRLGRSADTRKAMKLAAAEAAEAKSELVQTKHLLIGILAANEGNGVAILADAGLSAEGARAKMNQAGDDRK